MERRKVIQYLMVLISVFAIFFMIFIAILTRALFLEQGETSPQVYQEQKVEEEQQDNICECR